MAYVTLTNITVLDNPTAFTNPFQFEVTFECAHALEDGALVFICCVYLCVWISVYGGEKANVCSVRCVFIGILMVAVLVCI